MLRVREVGAGVIYCFICMTCGGTTVIEEEGTTGGDTTTTMCDCTDSGDCAQPADDCQMATCSDCVCGTTSLPDGTACAGGTCEDGLCGACPQPCGVGICQGTTCVYDIDAVCLWACDAFTACTEPYDCMTECRDRAENCSSAALGDLAACVDVLCDIEAWKPCFTSIACMVD